MSSLLRSVRWVPLLLLQGCLSTWIRLEDGTVLAPGRSDFDMAVGSAPRAEYRCPEGKSSWNTEDGRVNCGGGTTYQIGPDGSYSVIRSDAVPARLAYSREMHFALRWRLGLLGPFGPFTGLEGGGQIEAPTHPVSQEFHLALGLPGSDSLFSHSFGAGWGIGMWADNSWLAVYSASRAFGDWRPYASLRATLQATRFDGDFEDLRFHHRRTWDVQATGGVRWRLGAVRVLPDWLQLSGTLDLLRAGYPSLDEFDMPQPRGLGAAWAFGMGWGW